MLGLHCDPRSVPASLQGAVGSTVTAGVTLASAGAKLPEGRDQGNGTCVIERLEKLQHSRVVADSRRNVAKPVALHSDIHSCADKNGPLRAVCGVDVQRRPASRHSAKCVKRQCRDRSRSRFARLVISAPPNVLSKKYFPRTVRLNSLVRLSRQRARVFSGGVS